MGAEKKLLPIKEAFQLAQQPNQNQAKLVVALSRTYRTVSAPEPQAPGRRCPSLSSDSRDSAHRDSSLLKPPALATCGRSPGTPLSSAASGADRSSFVRGELGEKGLQVPRRPGTNNWA